VDTRMCIMTKQGINIEFISTDQGLKHLKKPKQLQYVCTDHGNKQITET
jgi:hypothetical protein